MDLPIQNRPIRTWPLHRCLRVRAFRMIEPTIALCAFDRNLGRIPTHSPILPLLKRSKFLWIPPVSSSWLSEWLVKMVEDVNMKLKNDIDLNGIYSSQWLSNGTPHLNSPSSVKIPAYLYYDERVISNTKDLSISSGGDHRVMLQFHGGGC